MYQILCIIWLGRSWFPAFLMHYEVLCIMMLCIIKMSTVGKLADTVEVKIRKNSIL